MAKENDAPLPATVKALGIVSLLTDCSSEMVYPVNSVMLRMLGAPASAIGLIEGLAEATASLLKLYSGTLSDRMGRRKPLTLMGYGLAAVTKPLIGLAGSWPQVLVARVLDRTGKGLRGAPRDALIADTCPKEQRGRAFGLHRSLDTTGAVLGPLLGYWFITTHPTGLRNLYWLAFLPALLGVLVLWWWVREPEKSPTTAPRTAFRLSFASLSPAYRRFLLAVGLFSLGNSSDQFLLLRAQEAGKLTPGGLLLLYALFNVVEAALGYTVGKASDRIGRRPVILVGWLVFALTYAGFAFLPERFGLPAVLGLFVLYGFYYTLTQGAQKALAADLVDPERRGEQLGAFHFLVGIAALPASLLAGALYDIKPIAPFLLGAVMALLGAVVLLRQDVAGRTEATGRVGS